MRKISAVLSTFIALLLLFEPDINAQNNCTVNAGGNATICGSTTTLVGSASGNTTATPPTWTFVSGPVTPVIASPNSMTTNVTGMTVDGDYTFTLSQECQTGIATSQVVITAHPRPASFTAGPDITNVCATTGITPLGGVIPAGFTGEWRAVNIWRYQRIDETISTNAQFSSTTISTPDFSIINKADHDIDPAYWVILTITSDDGVCSYEDTAIVRFIPNPNINPIINTSWCLSADADHYINLSSPPYFNTSYPGAAGTVAAGTTIDLNVISQPAGANMTFDRLDDDYYFLFNGVTVPGTYTFTITVTNSCGSYTSPTLTYTFEGLTPQLVNLQPVGHEAPEQLAIYSNVGSGGELHCDIAGTTTPQTFYFSVDPADPPTVITTVTPSGIIPPGGAPSIALAGAGTYDRVVTVTPPASGWSIGTYEFNIYVRNADGSCGIIQSYYIHVSDNSRPDVEVADVSVCYPGTGSISATIDLPEVYKGVVNSSYFQDFDGQYDIELISSPPGAATPAYTTTDLRSLTSASTVISNLDKIGDYHFRITPAGYNSSVGPFLNQEYACSGTLMADTFLVRVEGLINANAGSDQTVASNTASLAGNNPGTATGVWSVVSFPPGTPPGIVDVNSPLTSVTDMNVAGLYTFAWTITTPYGGCVSSDNVVINVTVTLSVKWLYFNTTMETDGILLSWGTASEQNNKGFEIERSADGIRWENIGFTASLSPAGNSDQPLAYQFTDTRPVAGTNFYRLKQIDLDDKYEYSKVNKVTLHDQDGLQFYPNPVRDNLRITGLKDITVVQLLNAHGQVIKTVPAYSLTTVRIHMAELPVGLYFIKTTGYAGKIRSYKLIKE